MAARGSLAFVFICLAIASASEAATLSYSYSGSNGPSFWGGLCAIRKDQSPINISKKQAVHNTNLAPISHNYLAGNATLVSDGHAIIVVPEGDFGTVGIDGKTYSLKQFHWHTPSEHLIDGIQYPAELHLFHKAVDGSVAVVAVLYKYGKPDPLLSKISSQLKEMSQEVCGSDEESQFPLGIVDPNIVRRRSRKHFRYMGSKTTPPCDEIVTWTILNKVREISKEQVESLKAPLGVNYKNNNRPVQPLNGRQVQFYTAPKKIN